MINKEFKHRNIPVNEFLTKVLSELVAIPGQGTFVFNSLHACSIAIIFNGVIVVRVVHNLYNLVKYHVSIELQPKKVSRIVVS